MIFEYDALPLGTMPVGSLAEVCVWVETGDLIAYAEVIRRRNGWHTVTLYGHGAPVSRGYRGHGAADAAEASAWDHVKAYASQACADWQETTGETCDGRHDGASACGVSFQTVCP